MGESYYSYPKLKGKRRPRNKREQSFDHLEFEKKEDVYENMKMYQKSKNRFINIYENWIPQRRNTLSELQTLKTEIEKENAEYNDRHETFKNVSYNSRQFKSSARDSDNFFTFLASATAAVFDAVDGISSVCQAVKTDDFIKKFNSIIESDKEITQPLYNAKYQCYSTYYGAEEVMRNYCMESWSSTMGKISDSFSIQKQEKQSSDFLQGFINTVSDLTDHSNSVNSSENVLCAVDSYMSSNPAILNACKSLTKAVVEGTDSWKICHKENTNACIGQLMTIHDTYELNSLRCSGESELEKKLDDAIRDLQLEMTEFQDMYYKLKSSFDDNATKSAHEIYYTE